MATTAHIDGLRPLSQSELASLLRKRRAESLASEPPKKQNPDSLSFNLRTQRAQATPVYHLALTEKASQDLYVRPKQEERKEDTVSSLENWLVKELKQFELWLPELRTHMRQEVQFVRRSWFVSSGQVFAMSGVLVVTLVAAGYLVIHF